MWPGKAETLMEIQVPQYVYFTNLHVTVCPGHICQESAVCYKNTDLKLYLREGQAEE